MVKDEVLRALEDARGTLLSGGRLAQALGVSRAAVWKAIEALRADGLAIEAVPGEGYRLAVDDDSLTAAGVQALLHTHTLGRSLTVLREVGSTNTLMKQSYAGEAGGFTLIAEQQTAGRGRLGRTFVSPPGGGLYLSVLLRPALPLGEISLLTTAAAVAVCRAVRVTCGFLPQIKWVNDVLMDGRKLCGILTEAAIEGETGAIDYVVVGIGVNLKLDRAALPDEVAAVAGALADFTAAPPRRAVFAAALLDALEDTVGLLTGGQRAMLLAEYRSLLCCIGRTVRVIAPAETYEAICTGLDDDGHLLVARPDGRTEVLSSGEISIRF